MGDSERRGDERAVPPQRGEGVEPDSPLDLEKPDWRETLKRTKKEMKADRVTLVAGGLAMFWFLAVFPAIIAAVGILGFVGGDATALSGGVQEMLPGDASEVIVEAISNANRQSQAASLAAALIGLALALWSASAGMVALQTGLNVAYDVAEERKFVKARGVAFLLILATAVLGGIASALFVFGDPIGEALGRALPLGDAFGIAWQIARWVVTVLAITILFALFYFLAPNRETPRWQWVSAGGILATLIWIIASLGFRLYVENFGSEGYAKTYGSMAGVVVLLLWLYFTGLAVMIGGELNAELERQSQKKKERRAGAPSGSPGGGSRRGDQVIGGLALLGGLVFAMRRRRGSKGGRAFGLGR